MTNELEECPICKKKKRLSKNYSVWDSDKKIWRYVCSECGKKW